MKPAFILMLTYNDTTVKDALKIFRECRDAPVAHWGFKDVGLSPAKCLEGKGAHGMDLLSYRYVGDAPRLLREVVRVTRIPIVSAGSIESYRRIAEVWQAGAWGFTVGTALFDRKFAPDGSFLDSVLEVCNWLERTNPSELDAYLD